MDGFVQGVLLSFAVTSARSSFHLRPERVVSTISRSRWTRARIAHRAEAARASNPTREASCGRNRGIALAYGIVVLLFIAGTIHRRALRAPRISARCDLQRDAIACRVGKSLLHPDRAGIDLRSPGR